MKRIQKLSLPEKITCAAEGRDPIFGGFMGGVYKLTETGIVPEKREADPISFLLKDKETEEYLRGKWNGIISMGNKNTNKNVNMCGPLPCKYISAVGEGFFLVSDTKSVYLRDINGILIGNPQEISTYVIKILHAYEKIVCFTGYKIYWMCVSGKGIEVEAVLDLHKWTDETETLTAIDESNGEIICGTIGGWIGKINSWEEISDFEFKKILKVGTEKIIDIKWYNKERKYVIGITPNRVFLIDIRREKIVSNIALSNANGLLAIRECPWEKNIFAVGDINFSIHIISTERVMQKNNLDKSITESISIAHTIKTPQDDKRQDNTNTQTKKGMEQIYNDLLEEIELGKC